MLTKKWDDKYATGIENIDSDHKNLIAQIDHIYNMLAYNKYDNKKYIDVINFLFNYANTHFEYEEMWMLENDYPNINEHKIDHRRFSKMISELVDNVNNSMGHLTLELLSFLRVWLLTHISVLDSDLGTFKREKLGLARVIGQ